MTVEMDEGAVERFRSVVGAWKLLVEAQGVADVKNAAQRETRRRRKVDPLRQVIDEERLRLHEWLDAAADDIGDLGDGTPVDDRERMWMQRLARYEILSDAIKASTDIYAGLYRLPEDAR